MDLEKLLAEVKRIISMPVCSVTEHDSLLEIIAQAMKADGKNVELLKNAQEKVLENRVFRESQRPLGESAKNMW